MSPFAALWLILLRGGVGGVGGLVVGLVVVSNLRPATNSYVWYLIGFTIAGILAQNVWKGLQTSNRPTGQAPPYTLPTQPEPPKTQLNSTISPVPGPVAQARPQSVPDLSTALPPGSNAYDDWSRWIAGRFGGTPEQIHVATTVALNALRNGLDSTAAAEAARSSLSPVSTK